MTARWTQPDPLQLLVPTPGDLPTPLGLCIVGCGHIARRHAQAAHGLRDRIRLSFASRDLSRARQYARQFGGASAFGSYEEAAKEPSVHAVLVCTPHHLHLEHAELAVRHGKHLLLEKPIARTLEEADRIIDETGAAGITLMVAENFRVMPAQRMGLELIRRGAVGEVRQLQTIGRGYAPPGGWRLKATEMGGGVFIDGGIHYVNFLLNAGGPVESVYALAPPKVIAEIEGEDTLFALIRFASGAVGVIGNSRGTPGMIRFQPMVISGTEGSLYVDPQGRFLFLRGGRRLVRFFFRDHRGHRAILEEFLGALREGREPIVSGAQARRDLAFVLAAYRSMREGRPVSVE